MFLRRLLRRPQDNAFVEKKKNILSRGMDAGFLGLLDVEGSEEKDEPSVDIYLE